MEFNIRSIDALLRNPAAGLPPNLSFAKSGEIDFRLKPGTLIDPAGRDADAAARLGKAQTSANGLPYGTCEFRNVHVIGPQGLIVSLGTRSVWKGLLFNWSDPVFDGIARRIAVFAPDSRTLDASETLFRGARRIKEAILIGAPGFGIYGHWILDYLPKLNEVVARNQQHLPFHYNAVKDWARDFAGLILPGGLPQPVADGNRVTFFERLIVPTSVRSPGLFDGAAARAAWQRVSDGLARMHRAGGIDAPPALIYISRRKWHRGQQERVLVNATDVEDFLENLGFEVIHPETLPLAEQRWMFSRARVVIGEDGSALHNTIFSPPGTRIGAISMGRTNTLHAAAANALDQRITYIPTASDGRLEGTTILYRLEIQHLKNALDRLQV